jgi:steroid delta-isomerase-like uncharacterized protein
MTIEVQAKNKDTVRRLYEQAINEGRTEVFEELVSDDFVGPFGARGAQAFAGVIGDLKKAFPDLRYRLDDLVAEGDRVVVRWTWKGTHKGPFRQFAPTNSEVANGGVAIHHVKDGKIGATFLLTDRLGFLDQIGVLPPGLAGPPAPAK